MSQQIEDTAGAPDSAPGEAAASPTYEGERIAKAIARAGIASRRDAEAMIEAGRVTLNGQTLASPAINVTESDRIAIDGEPLPARERTRLWLLHKPRGVVTTARDPEGRQTVFEILPEDLPRVVAVGRLDINTEGLLLLTNDGGLAKVIAHPETGWLRRYRVRAFGDVTQADLDRLRKGVTIEGMEYGPVEATLDRVQGDNVWLTMGLREGKNREVKRILEHLGLTVGRLIRLSFGPFQLGDLEPGLVEEIRTKVLKEQLGKTLASQAGVDFESPVREPIAAFGKPQKAAAQTARQSARETGARDGTREDARGERPLRRPASSAAAAGSGGRGGRDPARPAAGSGRAPAAAKRVPTGGSGPGPRESIWRAEDASGERARGGGAPRRGADPRAARAEAAERGRERVGAIRSGERRVLVERLQPSPEVPAPEPHRRVKFRTREEADARRSGPPRGERPSGGQRRDDRSAGERPPRGQGYGTGRGEGRSEGRADRSERSAGDEASFRAERRPGGVRGDRPAGGSETRGRGEGERSGGGGFRGGDRPGAGGKPGSFKPGGFKGGGFKGGGSAGGRSAERAEGGARGGARPGGKPGGKPGSKPGGGFRSGPSGERSGGGFKGAGRPGGARPGGGFKAGGGGRSGGGRSGGGKPGGRPGGAR